MKKALVLGMILLALGTFAFADGGVTVGLDWGRSQFNIASGSSAANSVVQQGWTGPFGTYPTDARADLQFAYSNQYTGYNITFYLGPNTFDAIAGANGGFPDNSQPFVNIVNFYGTLKLVPDMFTVYLGQFEGDGWDHFRLDSPHPVYDVNNDNVERFVGWGMILDLLPKDTGFEAAVFAKLPGPTDATTISLQGAIAEYGLEASYTVPNLVKISGGTNAFGNYATGIGGSEQRNINAAVQLLMVPNLTVWDEFFYAGFDQTPATTLFSDELAGQYVMKPLTIIWAAFFGSNVDYGQNTAGVPSGYATDNGATPFYGLGSASYTFWAFSPEIQYDVANGIALGLYAYICGNNYPNSGTGYAVEPYLLLRNFGLRLGFMYSGTTVQVAGTTLPSTWEVPLTVDWGF